MDTQRTTKSAPSLKAPQPCEAPKSSVTQADPAQRRDDVQSQDEGDKPVRPHPEIFTTPTNTPHTAAVVQITASSVKATQPHPPSRITPLQFARQRGEPLRFVTLNTRASMRLQWLIPCRSREAYGRCDIPQADSRDNDLGCPRDPMDRRHTRPGPHRLGRHPRDHRTRPFRRARTPRNSPDPYRRHGKQCLAVERPSPRLLSVDIRPNLQGIPRVRV